MAAVMSVVVAVVALVTLRLLAVYARTHEGDNFRVSDNWLAEHIRGRREEQQNR